MLFGSGSLSGVADDISDHDAIEYLYGWGNLSLDYEGNLRVLKPEPLELNERDHRRMYHARVLEGDLRLVLVVPVLWGPIVESQGLEADEGLQIVVDDVAKFAEGVSSELVDSVRDDIVIEMAREIVCEVCFEEDVPDVWEYHRRGAALCMAVFV